MKTNDRLIEFVKKIKAGDNAAFTDLYNESYKYLHTCVIHIVKDEDVAQDMIQDAYVEIYKNIGQLKDEAGFLGWAATIANRKCFAYLKKNKDLLVDEQTDDEGNESDYFDTIADDEAFIPENILDNQEKIKIIRDIIDDLTDVQRACVIGFYYNEQKQEEIANELGLPVNTVKSHLNRAKAKIKEAVGDTERKQGIKLYSIAPFMLLFFLKDTEVYAAELAVPAMSTGLSTAVSGSATTSSAVTTGAKAAGMAIKTKVIAGIVAGAVAVGVAAGFALNKEKPAEPEVIEAEFAENEKTNIVNVSINQRELMDAVSVYDMKLSSLTPTRIIEHMEAVKSDYENGNNVQIEEFIDNGQSNMSLIDYDGPLKGKNIGRGISFWNQDTDRTFVYKEFAEGRDESIYERNYNLCDSNSPESYTPQHENCIILINDSEIILVKGAENSIEWINDGNGNNSVNVRDAVERNTENKTYQGTDVPVDNFVVNMNKGKTLAVLLNEIHDDLYQLVSEGEEVKFNNGTMRLNVTDKYKSLVITFDDSTQNGYMFNKIIFGMDLEEVIEGTGYYGENGAEGFYSIGDRLDMLDSEGLEETGEMQTADNKGIQSESETGSKVGNEQGNIMSGDVDIDPLIGRADTMGWSMIKDVTDIISWGSTVYSASGKIVEVLCYNVSGDEIGMIEADRYTLGKGTWDLDCYYTGTEYEGCDFRVVVYDASEDMGPDTVWVQFYPVME